MTAGCLLDNNQIGQAVSPGSVVRSRIAELRGRGVKVGTCVPVPYMSEAGFEQVREPDVPTENLP